MKERIKEMIQESIETKKRLIENNLDDIEKAVSLIIDCYKNGKRIYTCGNGGSTCDAMHFAEEMVARYKRNRPALPAQALIDSGTVTCVGNDFGYDYIFARQVEAYAKEGDILLAISTSGNSPNILNAIEEAKKKNMKIIGFTGKDGGKMKDNCDLCIVVPSNETERIQESHITMIHCIIEMTENAIFPP